MPMPSNVKVSENYPIPEKMKAIRTDVQKKTGYMLQSDGTLPRGDADQLANSKGILQQRLRDLEAMVEDEYDMTIEEMREHLANNPNDPNAEVFYFKIHKFVDRARLNFQKKRILPITEPRRTKRSRGSPKRESRRLIARKRRRKVRV